MKKNNDMAYYLASTDYEIRYRIDFNSSFIKEPLEIHPIGLIKIGNFHLLIVKLNNRYYFDIHNEQVKNEKIDTLYLKEKFRDDDITDLLVNKVIEDFFSVHVFLPLKNDKEPISLEDLYHAYWAEVYDNYEEAKKNMV